jgi:tetratricopeptide (TPR) repeat protein
MADQEPPAPPMTDAEKVQKATEFNKFGALLYSKGMHLKAVIRYKKAIALNPSFAFAHYNLGVVLDDMGQTKKAIRHFRQAIEADPTFVEASQRQQSLFWRTTTSG